MNTLDEFPKVALAEARARAEALVAMMRPHCERCEVAGSVRRGKAEVKDIEIVAVPKWEERVSGSDLFGAERVKTNLLFEWAQGAQQSGLVEWIKPGTPAIVPWMIDPNGKYWRALARRPREPLTSATMKLDLFLARPENFGLIFLIRTGPAEFSQKLVTQKCKGGWMPDWMRVQDGRLWQDKDPHKDGEPIFTPDEESVFKAIGMGFVEPGERKI